MDAPTSEDQPKRTRRGVKRSRGGCQTCKTRRVKCDEQAPTCGVCKKVGVACDGYPKTAKKDAVYWENPPKLLPKPQTTEPQADDNSSEEERYFSRFQDRIYYTDPYSETEAWRKIVLQSSHIPAIRYGIIAIAALEEVSVSASFCHPPGSSIDENATHHQHMALTAYDKAITMSMNQDLRTTLLTCLVTAHFEALNGQYSTADAQICTARRLIDEWTAACSVNMQYGYGPAQPPEIEDELIWAIGRLQTSVPQ